MEMTTGGGTSPMDGGTSRMNSDTPWTGGDSSSAGLNVGKNERIVSMVAGGALALYGLQRRDLKGVVLALIGAEVVRRGKTGHCRLYDALGVSTADGAGVVPPRAKGEIVSDAATVNARESVKIKESITINRPRAEVYGVWRDFQSLPQY